MKKIFTLLCFTIIVQLTHAQAYFDLSTGALTQDWTNVAQITANDVWTGVPSIQGFAGIDASTTVAGTDPQTILVPFTGLQVFANQSAPNTFTSGGVAEFDGIANPTIALQGSGTADYPHIVIYLNTTGRSTITVSFTARDIDGSADNAIQPIAVQYRVGNAGNFTNLPAGFIADATTGPSLATLTTPVTVTLPAAADDQAMVEVRIITANAVGSDEWVGIDNIVVTPGSPLPISLKNFSASKTGNSTAFNWAVNCLSTSVTFELQRSSDAINFQTFYTSSESKARCAAPFDYTDANVVSGKNFYRLKIIDVDGKISYSEIKLVVNGVSDKGLISLRPTIVSVQAEVYYTSPIAEKIQWVITDMMGRVAKKITTTVISGDNKVVIPTGDLSTGQYQVKGFTSLGSTASVKFVKQ